MQMFRDKRSIFSLACELLCRLVKANELTKDQCNSPACKKRLDGLKDIIERKNRLEQRVRKATGASNKLPIGREAHNDGSQLYKVSTYESIEQASFMEHLMKLLAY